jgi:DNA-binding NarL/FixJ family response regulator
MAPAIIIVDRNTSAAQITCALVRRVRPNAQLLVVVPSMFTTLVTSDIPIALLLFDPSGASEVHLQYLQTLKHHQPTMRIVLLTAEPAARCAQIVRLVTVEAVLDKSTQPPILLNALKNLIDYYVPTH